MSDQKAGDGAQQAHFGIDRIYLKDLSLECPQGSSAFSKPWKPRIDLDINSSQGKLSEDLYEVVLRLTVTTKEEESQDTLFLIEIHQAGTFRVKGLSDVDVRHALATAAPTALFPYARETIDSLAVRANFPPLHLAPINFDALLAQAVERQKRAEAGAGTDTIQ